MAKYAVSANQGTTQANTTTYKTQLDLTAATGATTLRKAWIYDIMVGADAAPADNQITFKVDRQTSTGTRTSATPAPLDAGDAAALITAGVCTTIEGIVTSATQLIELSVNQRASYRWVAVPGCELVVPATNVAGLGLRSKSLAYTGTVTSEWHFFE